MDKIAQNKYPLVSQESNENMTDLPWYPTYPSSEDLYAQSNEEVEIDPEKFSSLKYYEEP